MGKGFFKGTTGSSSGNAFTPLHGDYEKAQRDYLTRDAQAGSREVMADPTLAKLFGPGGAMEDVGKDIGVARGEERDLATRGYGLTQDDKEAYGQASGNIAREFGQSENNLAAALRQRGISSSPMAGRSFMTSQGNKMEQLAGIQRQIADQRMQNNMARLGQTRNFMMGLMNQQRGLGQDYENARQNKDVFAQSKGQMGLAGMSNMQQQANQNYREQLATAKSSPFSRMVGGVAQSIGAGFGPSGGAIGGGIGEAMGSSSSSPEAGMRQGAANQDALVSLAGGSSSTADSTGGGSGGGGQDPYMQGYMDSQAGGKSGAQAGASQKQAAPSKGGKSQGAVTMVG